MWGGRRPLGQGRAGEGAAQPEGQRSETGGGEGGLCGRHRQAAKRHAGGRGASQPQPVPSQLRGGSLGRPLPAVSLGVNRSCPFRAVSGVFICFLQTSSKSPEAAVPPHRTAPLQQVSLAHAADTHVLRVPQGGVSNAGQDSHRCKCASPPGPPLQPPRLFLLLLSALAGEARESGAGNPEPQEGGELWGDPSTPGSTRSPSPPPTTPRTLRAMDGPVAVAVTTGIRASPWQLEFQSGSNSRLLILPQIPEVDWAAPHPRGHQADHVKITGVPSRCPQLPASVSHISARIQKPRF